MLSGPNRLKNQKDIETVFKKGKGFKEDFLILKTVKNNLRRCRFAFIVSNKVSKKATIRNKIRRRLSELVRVRLKKMEECGRDVILIASPGLESKDFWELDEVLDKLFKKSKMFEK